MGVYMSNKILFINGSPRRNGNTSIGVQWVQEGAISKGATVELINLASMKNVGNGCIGCRRCQKSEEYRCFINDDISKAVYGMTDYHVIVFAMPLFFGTVPAQMKGFMDRMYSHIKIKNGHSANPKFENKAFVMLATAGAENSNGLLFLEEYMKDFALEFKTRLYSFIIPSCNADPNVLIEKFNVREQAREFGEKLASIGVINV